VDPPILNAALFKYRKCIYTTKNYAFEYYRSISSTLCNGQLNGEPINQFINQLNEACCCGSSLNSCSKQCLKTRCIEEGSYML
jgi:hypothetical protein